MSVVSTVSSPLDLHVSTPSPVIRLSTHSGTRGRGVERKVTDVIVGAIIPQTSEEPVEVLCEVLVFSDDEELEAERVPSCCPAQGHAVPAAASSDALDVQDWQLTLTMSWLYLQPSPVPSVALSGNVVHVPVNGWPMMHAGQLSPARPAPLRSRLR